MYLFVATHLGSGAEILCDSLDKHPLVKKSSVTLFRSGLDLAKMKSDKAKIFYERIDYNYQIASKYIYSEAKFIIVVRDPLTCMSGLVEMYGEHAAERYYLFRLRRLYETTRKAKNFLVVSFKDLKGDLIYEKITKFLGLKEELINTSEIHDGEIYRGENSSLLQKKYNEYLSRIKSCPVPST